MEKLRNKMANLENELRGTKRKLADAQAQGGDGKGRGRGRSFKGSGKGAKGNVRGEVRLPEALRSKSVRTPNDEPKCFDYNLPHGCTKARAGERCQRGWHVCTEPGCAATHSMQQH